MSLPILETSRDDGQPVELYQFISGESRGFPPAPPAPGALITGIIVSELVVRDEGLTTESILCPPTSPNSSICAPRGTAADLFLAVSPPSLSSLDAFSVWGAYHGSIGGAGGWYFQRLVLSGLLPSHVYIVRTLAGTFSAFMPHGIRLGRAGGATENSLIGAVGVSIGNNSSATPVYADTSFTSSDSGLIIVDVGHFDLEAGYANVVYLDGLWLYDNAVAPGPDDPGGLPGTAYNYTSADKEIDFRGHTYLPAVFTRSDFRTGAMESLEEVELRMPRNHPVAGLFHQGLPILPVECVIYRVHRQDVVAGDSYTIPFVGEIAKARFEGPTCVVVLQTMRGLLTQKKPSLLVQSKCANMLYDRQCQLNRENFKFVTTVTAIDGFSVTLAGLATASSDDVGDDTNRFQYGFFIAPSGQHCFVTDVDIDTAIVLDVPRHVNIGDTVTIYYGCDRTVEVCHRRFANVQHMNARALMPSRNMFGPTGMSV